MIAAACGGNTPAVDTTSPPPAVSSTTTTIASPGAVATTTGNPPPSTTLPPPEAPPILLTWVSGFLPDDFGGLLRSIDGVDTVTVVSAGISDLVATRDEAGTSVQEAPGGFAFPLETFAVDPATYSAFLPRRESGILAAMAPHEIILGEASARLRGLGPGGVLEFANGATAQVVAVFADELIGAAEVVTVDPDSMAPGRLTPRYALVRGDVGVPELRAGLAAQLDPETPFQVKAQGEAPLLRHADAVRAQVEIKEQFGEFAYRDGEGRRIEIDPDWVSNNIVERQIPLLCTVKCHRQFADLLDEVIRGLDGAGSSEAIDRSAYLGCWNPRWISGRRGLSRHAWGVAADINFGNSTDGGPGSPVHPVLLEMMAAAEATSGHLWVQADPGHFEWYGPE